MHSSRGSSVANPEDDEEAWGKSEDEEEEDDEDAEVTGGPVEEEIRS